MNCKNLKLRPHLHDRSFILSHKIELQNVPHLLRAACNSSSRLWSCVWRSSNCMHFSANWSLTSASSVSNFLLIFSSSCLSCCSRLSRSSRSAMMASYLFLSFVSCFTFSSSSPTFRVMSCRRSSSDFFSLLNCWQKAQLC